jgi:hypothetical protein
LKTSPNRFEISDLRKVKGWVARLIIEEKNLVELFERRF